MPDLVENPEDRFCRDVAHSQGSCSQTEEASLMDSADEMKT